MNVLIDINHPGQVHLFRNLHALLKSRGHKVFVTVKDIPAAIELLTIYGISYIHLGSKSHSLIGKAVQQFKYDYRLLRILKREKIDIAMGSSPAVDHASLLTKTCSVHFSDDDPEVVPFVVKYAHPYADLIVCPDSLDFPRHSHKVIKYPAYHELTYLHPDIFTPGQAVLTENNINPSERYFILRFNAFRAHHDISHRGLTTIQKRTLVNTLKPFGRILITSESELEPEFEGYRLSAPPDKIHSLLSYATLFLGDSQTMTSEAAVLGTPALKCNSFAGRLSIPNELEERYGLCYSFLPDKFDEMIKLIPELLSLPDLKGEWQLRRKRMLGDKKNVNPFLVWLVENISTPAFVIKRHSDSYEENYSDNLSGNY
jgi:uncharacterized protein